jgi:hypothetical protein
MPGTVRNNLRMPGPYETGRSTNADPNPVESRDDFSEFVGAMLADFRASGAIEWENGTLERFLDGLEAFAHARTVNEPDKDQERASWQLFAGILAAATGYE